MVRKAVKPEIIALVIFQVTNILFVYKYAARFFENSFIWVFFYFVLVNLFLMLLYKDLDFVKPGKAHNIIFLVTTVTIAIGMVLLMQQFDPSRIRVGRFPALHDWIVRLLDGEYPYISPTRPSGFPFLFLLATPFYLLGDLGFMQIFAFLLYALLLYRKHDSNNTIPLRTLLLLISSPVFLYEVVTRSDLFSNMVFVLFYLNLCEVELRSARTELLVLAGIVGGLLLATRGVVLLVFVLFFGYIFKGYLSRGFAFLLGVVVGFCTAVLPFAVWNWQYFMNYGPLAIQTSYLPIWLSVLAIVGCLCVAAQAKSLINIYKAAGFVLFIVVCVAFVISLIDKGWAATIHGDRFDISYFCFALPFLLLTINYGRAKENPDYGAP
jgi:hypothetical protein